MLKPSLHYCAQRLGWRPDIVVGDLGYIHGETKREIREKWKVAIVTKLKTGMSIIAPFESEHRVTCPQGQPLQWLEYNPQEDRHWFGVRAAERFCNQCWQMSACPQEFGYPPSHHETLLGLIPLNTIAAQQLIQRARSWIEPAQSFEKNLLGMNCHFLNSLRLAWSLGLLADSVVLLRNLALLETPQEPISSKNSSQNSRFWTLDFRQSDCGGLRNHSVKSRTLDLNFVTPSFGTRRGFNFYPTLKTLGYSQTSLRDALEMLVAAV